MKPVVLMVGADKGGVGKTTVTRTVLDYLAAKNTLVRAFDAEYPRGTLQRFHPDVTEVVDVTTAADQMKMIDTLVDQRDQGQRHRHPRRPAGRDPEDAHRGRLLRSGATKANSTSA